MPLSRHSVGIYQETSSHATRQGTLAYSHLTVDGISVREPKKKKKKKAQARNELSNIIPKLSQTRKKPTPP